MSNFEQHIQGAQTTLGGLVGHAATLATAARGMCDALASGGKILACGNGGSASEAQHLVTELVGRFMSNRRSLPAIFLGGDVGTVTCIANDFAFEDIFSRPLAALGQPGDVL